MLNTLLDAGPSLTAARKHDTQMCACQAGKSRSSCRGQSLCCPRHPPHLGLHMLQQHRLHAGTSFAMHAGHSASQHMLQTSARAPDALQLSAPGRARTRRSTWPRGASLVSFFERKYCREAPRSWKNRLSHRLHQLERCLNDLHTRWLCWQSALKPPRDLLPGIWMPSMGLAL